MLQRNIFKFSIIYLLFFYINIGVNAVNFEEYTLKNGLKVILYQTNKFPVAIMHIAYKVGSRDEKRGESGIAHICEHMMFNGTKSLKRDQIDGLIKQAGGYSNAYTSDDITNYYIVLPPYNLEIGLRIESDRMENAVMDKKIFEKEMKVIKQEKLMRYGNSPWGRFWNYFSEHFYDNFDYQHPTIGYDRDLNSITIEQVRKFYNTYYKPNNATLLIAGNFEIDKVKKLIDKYFTPLKPSHIDNRPVLHPLKQNRGYKEFVFSDSAMTTNFLIYNMPAPNYGTEDYENLLVLSYLLGNGYSSILQRDLVLSGMANSVWSSLNVGRIGKYFSIGINYTDKSLERKIKNKIFDELEKIKLGNFSQEDLQRAKNLIEAEKIFENENIIQMASILSVLAVHYRASYVNELLPHIKKINKKDIINTAKKYFHRDNFYLFKIVTLTKGNSKKMKIQNKIKYNNDIPIYSPDIDTLEKYLSFLKKVKVKTLPNGIKVIVLQSENFHTTTLNVTIKAGPSFKPELNGIPQLLINMLDEGTKHYSKERIDKLMDFYGLHFAFSSGYETLNINSKFLTKYKKPAYLLLKDMLLYPQFPQKALKRLKNIKMIGILSSKKDPKELENNTFLEAIYGKSHPYAINSEGDEDIIKKAKRMDLVNYYRDNIIPANVIITIVSNESPNSVFKDIETYLGKWKRKGKINKICQFEKVNLYKKEIISKKIPNIQQAIVSFGFNGINYQSKDKNALKLITTMLGGGSLTSILGKVIRRDNGLAYYVYCYNQDKASGGFIKISSGIAPKNVKKFEQLVEKTLNNITKKGFDNSIINKTKNYLIGIKVATITSNDDVVSFLQNIYYDGNNVNNYIKSFKEIMNLDEKILLKIYKKYFDKPYKIIEILPKEDKNGNNK